MSSLRIPVLDIVVNEREVVDELQRDRRRESLAPIAPDGLAGQEAQRRAQLLAATGGDRTAILVLPAQVVAQHSV